MYLFKGWMWWISLLQGWCCAAKNGNQAAFFYCRENFLSWRGLQVRLCPSEVHAVHGEFSFVFTVFIELCSFHFNVPFFSWFCHGITCSARKQKGTMWPICSDTELVTLILGAHLKTVLIVLCCQMKMWLKHPWFGFFAAPLPQHPYLKQFSTISSSVLLIEL